MDGMKTKKMEVEVSRENGTEQEKEGYVNFCVTIQRYEEHPLKSLALKCVETGTISTRCFVNHLSHARVCLFHIGKSKNVCEIPSAYQTLFLTWGKQA